MEEIEIYNADEFEKMKEIKTADFMGYVYVIDCGNVVKIGQTSNPYKRISNLKIILENYGNLKMLRIGVSKAHTNYRTNETILHKMFADKRVENTELFRVSFGDVVTKIVLDLRYEDKSKELEADCAESSRKLFELVFGDTTPKYDFNKMTGVEAEIIIGLAMEYMCAKDDYLKYLERYIVNKDLGVCDKKEFYDDLKDTVNDKKTDITLKKMCNELATAIEEFAKAKEMQKNALDILIQASALWNTASDRLDDVEELKQAYLDKIDTVYECRQQNKKDRGLAEG
jgi:hypothetical protein